MQNVTNTVFLKALGEKLRKLRLEQHLTQEDVGFKVGNSGKQIGRIERGEHNVTSCMLYQICKALNISLKELFDFEVEELPKAKTKK